MRKETLMTLMTKAGGPEYCHAAGKVARKLQPYVEKVWETGKQWRIGVRMYGKDYVLQWGSWGKQGQGVTLAHIWLETVADTGEAAGIYDNLCIYLDSKGGVEYRTWDILGIAAGDLIEDGPDEEPQVLGQ